MFKVLDACARYKINEIDAFEAIERLKLKNITSNSSEAETLVAEYCAVFTPNERTKY